MRSIVWRATSLPFNAEHTVTAAADAAHVVERPNCGNDLPGSRAGPRP